MLLRKTRAESVLPVWRDLLSRYPTATAMADAPEDELIRLLQPLGLHHIRARALRDVGRRLLLECGGEVPLDAAYLETLPHVGRYGASALVALYGASPSPAVDANVVRILHRAFGFALPVEVHKADCLWDGLQAITPAGKARAVNLALVDLGALICQPRAPRCEICPGQSYCAFGRQTRRGIVGNSTP